MNLDRGQKKVAVFGGSFNPPGLHHIEIAKLLSEQFDRVVVVPCGPRPDKTSVADTLPVFRSALVDKAFGGIPKVDVDLFDLEQNTFTRTFDLERRYEKYGEVWHVVGGDLVAHGKDGNSLIQKTWYRGEELWEKSRFAVVMREGFDVDQADLPPHHLLISEKVQGSSSEIRDRLVDGGDANGHLPPVVLDYIRRYGLYRRSIPGVISRASFEDLRPKLVWDRKNEKAAKLVETYFSSEEHKEPNAVVVLGGDGTMLRAIREFWRLRLPFFGINSGHRGFLMNQLSEVEKVGFPPREVVLRKLPMLFLEMEELGGEWKVGRAFNDAWVERAGSQSAWLKVTINGEERLSRLVADGALVSTPAGSTAYALSMGGPPLLADTAGWLLVGSNVMAPMPWKFAMLSPDAVVEIEVLNPEKRPVRVCLDGLDQGLVKRFRARLSRAAAAELAFYPSHDMAERIAEVQFAKFKEF